MTRRPRQSQKDRLRANDKSQHGWANVFGKPVPPELLNNVPATVPRIRKPSDPARVLERDVLKAVLHYLRVHPKIASVERTQSGVFMEGNRTIRVGFRGKLDVTFLLKTGRYGEVEIKRPGGKPTPEQQRRIDHILRNGGVSGCVSSVDEMQALLA